MEYEVAYVTVRVKISPGADVQDVISECDYSFCHGDIHGHEIVDVEEKKEKEKEENDRSNRRR